MQTAWQADVEDAELLDELEQELAVYETAESEALFWALLELEEDD